jgi:hypothetical protein
MPDFCKDCGKNLALVGLAHRCTPRDVSHVVTEPTAMANAMANTTEAKEQGGGVSTYQYRSPIARRAYQRDLMRRRRASKTPNKGTL